MKVRADAEGRVSFLDWKQHALRWRSLFASDAEATGLKEQKEQDNTMKMRGGSGIMGVFRRKTGGNAKIAEDAP